ncbi:hypothetical protein CQ10_19280 [Bradyrhizobium valentinum]|nr:hypothetical protein CQ10_19280 [Bradyrhizobium valentinum]
MESLAFGCCNGRPALGETIGMLGLRQRRCRAAWLSIGGSNARCFLKEATAILRPNQTALLEFCNLLGGDLPAAFEFAAKRTGCPACRRSSRWTVAVAAELD